MGKGERREGGRESLSRDVKMPRTGFYSNKKHTRFPFYSISAVNYGLLACQWKLICNVNRILRILDF